MERFPAQALAQMIGKHMPCQIDSGDPNVLVGPQIVIDSREATPGCLFVALEGEHSDGHSFIRQAAEKGAVAALTSKDCQADLATIRSEDSQEALTNLARELVTQARGHGLSVLAVTGSSGKTSTKDFLGHILRSWAPTICPSGSHNNELGTPWMACQVDSTTRFLVSEMGARGIGHIAYLCSIVHPDIAIVVNVGNAHLGEFGSREAVAQAKGEIVEDLPGDGWAVLNADDPLVWQMRSRTLAKIAAFTLADQCPADADLCVQATDVHADELERYSFTLRARKHEARISLGTSGIHMVSDALAAACAALCAGVDFDHVAAALDRAQVSSSWRMEIHECASGVTIINDAYNANPASMNAALHTLAKIGQNRRDQGKTGRTIAIVGDMYELGSDSDQLHRLTGKTAYDLGIDRIIAVGQFADLIASGVPDPARAITVQPEDIHLDLVPGDVVLVKASRALGLEKIADRLIAKENQ